MTVSRPPAEATTSQSPTRESTVWRSVSECGEDEDGERLRRMEPVRKTGSWGMTLMRSRRVWRGMVEMSMLSIVIEPDCISSMWKRRATKLDLPDPEGPQMPSFWPAGMWRVMDCKAGSPSAA